MKSSHTCITVGALYNEGPYCESAAIRNIKISLAKNTGATQIMTYFYYSTQIKLN